MYGSKVAWSRPSWIDKGKFQANSKALTHGYEAAAVSVERTVGLVLFHKQMTMIRNVLFQMGEQQLKIYFV